MIVVKVGGSLFGHPRLGSGLRAFVESLAPADVLLVAGGGPVADAVRELDRVHELGEEAAHWLALRSLGVTAALLEALIGKPTPPSPPSLKGRGEEAPPISVSFNDAQEARRELTPFPSGRGAGGGGLSRIERGAGSVDLRLRVLDCLTFAREDEPRPGALPHTWSVTTDSIAARAAAVFRAERLVLLKSVDVPHDASWEVAAANGWVDAHFPQITATIACPIEAVNFRRWLDARA